MPRIPQIRSLLALLLGLGAAACTANSHSAPPVQPPATGISGSHGGATNYLNKQGVKPAVQ